MPERRDDGDPVVLDTHVRIWLLAGESARIGKGAVDAIERESRRGGPRVSAISVWEVAMLEATGRIGLAMSVHEWIRAALRARGVQLLELTPEIAVESARLPRDARVLGYAADGHVRVLDATP